MIPTPRVKAKPKAKQQPRRRRWENGHLVEEPLDEEQDEQEEEEEEWDERDDADWADPEGEEAPAPFLNMSDISHRKQAKTEKWEWHWKWGWYDSNAWETQSTKTSKSDKPEPIKVKTPYEEAAEILAHLQLKCPRLADKLEDLIKLVASHWREDV